MPKKEKDNNNSTRRVDYPKPDSIPDCLKPFRVNARIGVNYYQDLSDHKFSSIEKIFMCQEIQRSRDNENFYLEATNMIGGRGVVSIRGLSERYCVSLLTITEWFKRFKVGAVIQGADVKGQPHAIDEEELEALKVSIQTADKIKKPLSTKDVYALCGVAKVRTAWKRGRILPDEDSKVDRKTFNQYIELAGIDIRKAQFMTQARIDALLDIRLTYRMACCYYAYASHLPSYYKWNADCTTIECSTSGEETRFCVIRERNDREQVTSTDVTGDLSLLVKLFGLGNAGGEIGPLTAIVAIKDLPEGEFYAEQVTCFTCSTEVADAPGWLYFCRSKGGCAALWRHWFVNVCIPTMCKSAEVHNNSKVSQFTYFIS